jgi:two-component system sensor histidine kinase/response regulator
VSLPSAPTVSGDGARVLVVDDEAMNRELLRDHLAACGHAVEEADSGEAALTSFRAARPDVILLDLMMPGMDGFEVLRRLRAEPGATGLPIIVISSLSDHESRFRAIELSADDFLTKPVYLAELLLRVRNAVRVKRLRDQLGAELARVKQLEEWRDSLTHMMVHDLRSPLMGLGGFLELLANHAKDHPVVTELAGNAMAIAGTLNEMVSAMLDVSRFEAGLLPLDRQRADLRRTIRHGLDMVRGLAALESIPVRVVTPDDDVVVPHDAMLVARVIANLAANAIRHSRAGDEVGVSLARSDGVVRVVVSDMGPGIPPEMHARIFDKFWAAPVGGGHRRYSSGLGLTFCRHAVEAHGGAIGVESDAGRGSRFWFTLPAEARP